MTVKTLTFRYADGDPVTVQIFDDARSSLLLQAASTNSDGAWTETMPVGVRLAGVVAVDVTVLEVE